MKAGLRIASVCGVRGVILTNRRSCILWHSIWQGICCKPCGHDFYLVKSQSDLLQMFVCQGPMVCCALSIQILTATGQRGEDQTNATITIACSVSYPPWRGVQIERCLLPSLPDSLHSETSAFGDILLYLQTYFCTRGRHISTLTIFWSLLLLSTSSSLGPTVVSTASSQFSRVTACHASSLYRKILM